MPVPTRPATLYVVNGWWLDIPGLVSAHFETLDGVEKTGGTVNIADAGANKVMSFSGQLMSFGTMTLSRTSQGDANDVAIASIVDACIRRGLKFPAVLTKTHNLTEVYRILFDVFRLTSEKYPNFDINSGEKLMLSYGATCDDWNVI